jgi:hypothetical protein
MLRCPRGRYPQGPDHIRYQKLKEQRQMDKAKYQRISRKLRAMLNVQGKHAVTVDTSGKAYIETRKGDVIRRRPRP